MTIDNCAWLSLDETDNDPVRFLSYLIAALQTAVPGIGQTAVHLLQSPEPPAAEAILTLLINDVSQSDQPIILVLEDYHVITTPAVHQALTFLLDHLPPLLHLLITARSDPPLHLPRLRAGREMVEIRTNDLRFTIAEASRFFNEVMGLTLSNEETEALEALDRAYQIGRHTQVSFVVTQAAALRARLQLAQGDLEAAGVWAANSGLSPDDPEASHPGLREEEYLSLARVLTAQSRNAEALSLLDRLWQAAAAEERMGSAIVIRILQALIMQAQGNTARVLTFRERALVLAEPEGYIRVFVDEGEPLPALL